MEPADSMYCFNPLFHKEGLWRVRFHLQGWGEEKAKHAWGNRRIPENNLLAQ